MVKFLLYLFESGLCLTILFIVYHFFFKKETYFNFNRIYLISIIIISLILPIIHVTINVNNPEKYEFTFNEIGKYRNYYEHLIALTDPDYLNTSHNDIDQFNDFDFTSTTNSKINNSVAPIIDQQINENKTNIIKSNFNIAHFIFAIYIVGLFIFLIRIIALFRWIIKTLKSNQIEKNSNIKVVNVKSDLPPFSFLGYIFINPKAKQDHYYNKILIHEKVHVYQFHSLDLLLAHFISIFQWFNPIVWKLQKSIKTNHEYIADNEVIRRGYNLLDYQELLLNQFITIPSVQLVNNFNLISIRKRITMMNKIKSGFLAKLKALVVIPAALFAFILFANLTLNGPNKILTNFSILKNNNQIFGMWENTSNTTYGFKILIENSKFSVLEKNIILKEYPYQIEDNFIVLKQANKNEIRLKYKVENNELRIWWTSNKYSVYKKSLHNNTLDAYLSQYDEKIELPVLENYSLIQRLDICIDVAMVDDKVYVNKERTSYADLKEVILKEKSKINQLNTNLTTICIYADKELSMKYMHILHQTLREIGIYKVAHVGKVTDRKVSKLHTNFIALPKKLPPLNMKELGLKDLDESIKYIEFDARKTENTPELLKPKLEQHIRSSQKYIAGLYYNKTTILDNYLDFQDMIRNVIYDYRSKYAIEKFKLPYYELSTSQQKEIKKIYPLIITEKYYE